jgi:hypothetical protein
MIRNNRNNQNILNNFWNNFLKFLYLNRVVQLLKMKQLVRIVAVNNKKIFLI